MLLKNQHPNNKSIMVGLLGIPNVGKSSLVNCLLGFDLSVVTHRPQTTRNQYHCTTTIDLTEIIFVDTPGVHKSNKEFNKRLNGQVKEGLEGADLNLLLIDLTTDIIEDFHYFIESYQKNLNKTWVVFTKSDLLPDKDKIPFDDIFKTMKERVPTLEKYFVVSSKTDDEIHTLTGAICDEAQPGPHLYPRGDVSNKNERFFVTEYIREQAFLMLHEELPYELAVVIEDFTDHRRDNNPDYKDYNDRKDNKDNKDDKDKMVPKSGIVASISANIIVNKPSQRAIVIGRAGCVIKEIGTKARARIEEMIGGPIFLNLHVKVVNKWQKNNNILEEIGLPRVQDSKRVWRKRV